MTVVFSHHQQVHVLKQSIVNTQQNTSPQASSLSDRLRSHTPPRRRESSPKLACAVLWGGPFPGPGGRCSASVRARSFESSAARPWALRVFRRRSARRCASPACSRLCACWAAAFPLAVDRHLDQFWFPGTLSNAASNIGARVFMQPRAAGGPAESGRVELPVTRRCLFHSERLNFPGLLPAGDIQESWSPARASAWHHADTDVSPP